MDTRAADPRRAAPAFICPSCDRSTYPVTYFSRGANLAKLAMLAIPFNFVGPLIFFFLRKDQLVCAWCRNLLAIQGPVGLLGAAPPAETALIAADQTDEPSFLERRSRRHRRGAWQLGTAAALWGGLAGFFAVVDPTATAFVFPAAFAGLFGVGTAASALRSKALAREAEAKRRREQRLRLLQLARAEGGRLSVTVAAAHLGVEFGEAEQVLDSLVDGHRVDMQVDDQGRITYAFLEITG